MAQKRLTAWQKATALVPLALLSGAWTASIAVGGSASATASESTTTLPDGTTVPNEALEAPASLTTAGSLAPGVPDGAADAVIADASTNGIPDAALAAYQRGAQVIGSADPGCNLSWHLIAAIGRVESDHGRYGGNTLGEDGVSRPGIFGIPLDGSNGTAEIKDTDAGQHDDDQVWDRAVGPMQFIPSTWSVVGVDGDGDGVRNPQDIDDAALASAVYLCSGQEDLSTYGGQKAAVYRYNHSQEYVDLVIAIMNAYLEGDYSSVPNGVATSMVFSPSFGDAVITPATTGRPQPEPRTAPARDARRGGGSTGSTGGGGTTGGDDGDSPAAPPLPGDDGTGDDPAQEPTKTLDDTVEETTKKVTELVEETTKKVTDPVDGATGGSLSHADAKAQCLAEGVPTLNLEACIADKLG